MITREQWLALPDRARRLTWARLTPDEQEGLRGLFTATTPGDALRYPNDYNAPADSPAAFRDLANDTQAALNRHVDLATTFSHVTLASGWKVNTDHYGQLAIYRMGKVCIGHGLVRRATALAVDDNTIYKIGDINSTFCHPVTSVRFSAIWTATVSTGHQNMSGEVVIYNDGEINLVTHSPGTIGVDDWVSLGGASWMAA